ncbi:MAG TPA: hypothetical protein VEY33_14525 [Gemmatimonadota bacterium]|nr:hypothetical protein [Gemmatimonadota bacterium]
MTIGTILSRTRLARPVAAGLAAVLVALSVSAGFHSGDHDDLGWLPSRFHQHDYRWAGEASDALPLVDHCLACNLTRTIVRLAPPAPSLPEAPDPVFAGPAGPADEAPTRADFSSTPRAPPAS